MNLDFEKLPLLEVRLHLSFVKGFDLTIDSVSSIREKLRSILPEIELRHDSALFPAQPSSGLQFQFFTTQPISPRFLNAERTIAVDISGNLIQILWQSPPHKIGEPIYPRYKALRSILADVTAAVMVHQKSDNPPQITNLTYVDILDAWDGEGKSRLLDYLSGEILPKIVGNSELLHDLNYSYRMESGIDIRLQVAPSSFPDSRPGYALITSGGKIVDSDQDYLNAIDLVHSELQPFFVSLLTQKAQEEFGLAVRA